MNLYQKINKIKKEVGSIEKDVTVGMGKNSYKATSHDNVLIAVRKAMIENGVVEKVTNIQEDSFRENYTAYDVAKIRTFTKIKIVMTFVNADSSPLESFDIESIGHADDPSDKGAGKALSYAVKYAYMKLFGLSTGENDEERINYDKPLNTPTHTNPTSAPVITKAAILTAFKNSTSIAKLDEKWDKAQGTEFKGDSEVIAQYNAKKAELAK